MLRSVGAIAFGIASDRYEHKWPFVINNLLFIVLELVSCFSLLFIPGPQYFSVVPVRNLGIPVVGSEPVCQALFDWLGANPGPAAPGATTPDESR